MPREHGVGIHVERPGCSKALPSYASGLSGNVVCMVPFVEHQLHLAFVAIDRQPALPRQVHRRPIRLGRVGQEHSRQPPPGGMSRT